MKLVEPWQTQRAKLDLTSLFKVRIRCKYLKKN